MIVKVTIALLVALLAAMLTRRAAAATRYAILIAGQMAALLLPLLVNVVPPVRIEAPVVAEAPSASSWSGGLLARRVISNRRAESPPLHFIWGLGFVVIASLRMRSYIRAAMIVRRSHSFGGVLLSDEVDQPSTFFSRILLPAAAMDWSDARLRAVLLHEQAHVARRDSLLGLIGDAVCAIYWFHPLAWLTARRARLERERACDDAVLTRGVAPVDYATALLDVARHAQRSAGLAMAERTQLGRRIAAILDSDVSRRATRAARASVLAATIIVAPLLAALTTLSSIPLPRGGEPDRRDDAVASPFSERIGAPSVEVAPVGRDAAFIATMQAASQREPQTPVDFVADRARWALGRVQDGELVTPLLAALRDDDWRVRAYAAWALGHSGDARATAPIAALLEDDVWRVRAAAAAALSHLADPAAADAMQRALSDDAWQVRSAAVHYFAATGGSSQLFETMKRDRHIAVRNAAEEASR